MNVTGEVVSLMGEIAVRFNRGYEEAATRHQLTALQAKALVLVAAEPLPMRRMARLFNCDPSNVTGIVDRLEARGFVRREPDPADRRVKNVTLTPEGRQVVRELRHSLGFAAAPLAALTEAERIQLRDLLKRMLEADTAAGAR
ncbi:MarR family winged helix-turn-helix transcriptional regulator [Planomonospora venezuelensis]|uniref:DNA-binding MarR family transcriptional regulator n=1 Tax=Planomonospora venezuelensis TaxID=1999 RepID=A0A841CUI8_PLAVE|nr:MarR family transcriptional regulator [Planomonospora venezuelensis]MBB5960979.1 DNA-binding MarR family transcriptional regulator [Planomonospora venezuelensis]